METINNLEQLLNSLIEKGWKPYGMEQYDRFIIESAGDMCFRWKYPGADGESAFDYNYDYFKIRELASIDSGLWQFVCEKGYEIALEGEKPYIERDYILDSEYYDISDYQYWLMVGALLDEDKLEDFLLSNIKVEG